MMNSVPQQGGSGPRSSFAQKCNLLSMYLKEKRSFAAGGDHNLGMPINGEVRQTTMNLFPQEAGLFRYQETYTPKTNTKSSHVPDQNKSAQMTIFYDGQVFVLDNLPVNKAREIMHVAGRGSTGDLMPLTRTASLYRFFEKRKDRIRAKAPYSLPKKTEQTTSGDLSKVNNIDHGKSAASFASSWLGLAAQPAA